MVSGGDVFDDDDEFGYVLQWLSLNSHLRTKQSSLVNIRRGTGEVVGSRFGRSNSIEIRFNVRFIAHKQ